MSSKRIVLDTLMTKFEALIDAHQNLLDHLEDHDLSNIECLAGHLDLVNDPHSFYSADVTDSQLGEKIEASRLYYVDLWYKLRKELSNVEEELYRNATRPTA